MANAVRRNTVSSRVSLAAAAVALNLAIALPLAGTLNIWQDEAYTLNTTAASFDYALRQAIGFEQNAPLYFLIVVFLRHFGQSVFFLRSFSVLCAVVTVLLVPAIVRRYVPRADAGLVAIVVACNPFLIRSAVDMRVYALVVLMSALLLLAFFEAFLEDEPSPWAGLGYAVCVSLALYTQYYLAFVVAAEALVVALWNRRRALRFAAACIAGGVAFAPMLATVPAQVHNFRAGFESPTLAHSFATLTSIAWRYLVPLPASGGKLVYAALTVVVVLALARYRPALTLRGGGTIVVIASAAVVFFAAGTNAAGVHVLDRHAASLYIPVTLSAFAVIAALPSPLGARVAVYAAAGLVALSALTLTTNYRALATPGDWSRVAVYLQDRERAGEPIVVFEAENALPLAYYYRGRNRIVPIPRAVDFRTYNVMSFVIRNEAQLRAVMPRAPRVWLVTANECTSANIQFGCPTLEGFVERQYRTLSDAHFFGSRVRLLRPLHRERER